MNFLWGNLRSLDVFHNLIKADPKLEARCLAWEAKCRLSPVALYRRSEPNFIVLCDRTTESDSHGIFWKSFTYQLYNLQSQRFIGNHFVTDVYSHTLESTTATLLWTVGLRTFCRDLPNTTYGAVCRRLRRQFKLQEFTIPCDDGNQRTVFAIVVTCKLSTRTRTELWEPVDAQGRFLNSRNRPLSNISDSRQP